VGDKMRIWKPIGIAATIISLGCSVNTNFKDVCEGQKGSALEECVSSTYGLSFKDYQAIKTQSYSQPAFSCQQRSSSPPAQQQPPAPQHYLLETHTWQINPDDPNNCIVSPIDPNTASADYSISTDANCTSTPEGIVNVNFGIKNLTDGVVLNDVIGVLKMLNAPVIVNYPTAVTSTGCEAGCPYFVSGDLAYKNPVTRAVEVDNRLENGTFAAEINWYNKK
jgi:hypothetical protein